LPRSGIHPGVETIILGKVTFQVSNCYTQAMIWNKNTLSYFVALAAFVCMLTVNALANILPINGLNTGQVAGLYRNFFLPASMTFSIWSVIYGFLIVFLVLAWSRRHEVIVSKILPYFTLSCILNLSWIIVWHFLLPGISVMIMLGLLAVLAIIFVFVQSEDSGDLKIKTWLHVSMTVYFAWICVATIANISAFLVSLDWRGGFISEQAWAVIMMSVATLLALTITGKFNSPWFSIVVIWAILGICIRWIESDHLAIIYSAILLIVVMVIHLVSVARRKAF
jgi:hypothetical protein